MKLHPTTHRLIAGSLFVTFALAALAPAAFAGHGWGQTRKFRRGDEGGFGSTRGGYETRRVEFRRSSGGGSTLAGFIGGLAVGAILSNVSQARACPPPRQVVYERTSYCPPPVVYERQSYCPPPGDEYSYEDPYCRERFASLDLCLAHARHECEHEIVVRVIDDRDGDCVDV